VPDGKESPPRWKKSRVVPFYQVASAARGTCTDAAFPRRDGGRYAFLPSRYMHTPNELLSLEDLENSAMKTVPSFFPPATQ
jgi:putative aminopeptidase FrvX